MTTLVNKSNALKGIIFDLDGTLANTLHVSIASFKKSLEPLIGRSLSQTEIIETFGPTEEGTIRALAPDYFERGITDYLSNYKELHSICPKPFEGIVEILQHLQQQEIRLGIVTGKGDVSTMITLDYLGLKSFFPVIETGSPLMSIKEKSLAKILNNWNDLEKKSIIYVGDTLVDIQASESVGISIVSAAWSDLADKEILAKYNPDNTFYTIEDFAVWIKKNIE